MPSDLIAVNEPVAVNVQHGASEALATFVAGLTVSDVSDEAQTMLTGCQLDFAGIAAFASQFGESSAAVRAAVGALDPVNGASSAIGEARGYSAPYAAMLNGVWAHTLDFDDTNQHMTGHPGAPVLAACLVEAERLDASGEEFLLAAVAGYEVAVRIGAGLNQGGYDRGYHITGVSGIFGALAAIAKLRHWTAETLLRGFGIALSKAAGSMQYLENGSWNKRLHPGLAAHDAFQCAAMADAGVTGAAKPFEGRYGLLASYSSTPNVEVLTSGLGRDWLLLDTALKPYPSCRLTHGAVDAALALREEAAEPDRPSAVLHVMLSPTSWKITGKPTPGKLAPRNIVDAQFSAYYQVAVAWLHGFPTWQDYDRLDAPDVLSMIERISCDVDPTLPKAGAILRVSARPAHLERKVTIPLGEPEAPLGWAGISRKFQSMAVPVYGEAKAERIAAAIKKLRDLPSIRVLTTLLRREPTD